MAWAATVKDIFRPTALKITLSVFAALFLTGFGFFVGLFSVHGPDWPLYIASVFLLPGMLLGWLGAEGTVAMVLFVPLQFVYIYALVSFGVYFSGRGPKKVSR